jgi:hypothetical protein
MSDKTPKHRNAAICLAVIGLMLLTGCTGNLGNGNANADNDRNSGFYGGITGGGNRL